MGGPLHSHYIAWLGRTLTLCRPSVFEVLPAPLKGIDYGAGGKRTMPEEACSHIAGITTLKHAGRRECEECVKTGSRWVHLRTCQECGTTLCCDSSPNRHATKHAHASGHPVIASAEPGERWLYCYPDDAFAEY